MLHLPILRYGVPYRSLDLVRVPHHRTREPFVEISQANAGLIRRDLRSASQDAARRALAAVPVRELLAMSARAADLFEREMLPVGDQPQTPDGYVRQLSATTGMPHVLVRRNMRKIANVLTEMPAILRGLTRGLDLSILDSGHGEHGGHAISYYPRTQALGGVAAGGRRADERDERPARCRRRPRGPLPRRPRGIPGLPCRDRRPVRHRGRSRNRRRLRRRDADPRQMPARPRGAFAGRRPGREPARGRSDRGHRRMVDRGPLLLRRRLGHRRGGPVPGPQPPRPAGPAGDRGPARPRSASPATRRRRR